MKTLEIERKYLIEKPDIGKITDGLDGIEVKIVQTYLRSDNPNIERRIRTITMWGETSYVFTTKEDMGDGGLTRKETEVEIDKDYYEELLREREPDFMTIEKTRYVANYLEGTLEIDIYPFLRDKAVLEIEIDHADQKIDLPDFIEVIKEVTKDPQFKNKALAKSHGTIEL